MVLIEKHTLKHHMQALTGLFPTICTTMFAQSGSLDSDFDGDG